VRPGSENWRRHDGGKLDSRRVTGLILAGMGGPDGDAAVRPFLRNLFADPAILPLPKLLAAPLGAFLARRRAPAVRERYLEMGLGGASPQLDWTRRQADRLTELLEARGLKVVAAPAMRYWHPFADEAVEDLLCRGAEQFLVLPTYPQYATPTSGSSLDDVCAAVRRAAPEAGLTPVSDWHLLPGYHEALADHAAASLNAWADAGRDPGACALVYTAHSLPERFLKQGDPYLDQTVASVALAHERLVERLSPHVSWMNGVVGIGEPRLAFQSKVGPLRWLGPSLRETCRELVAEGCRRLLVQPVSFTCEQIETLHELDIELATDLKTRGLAEFRRGSALGLHEGWLASLGEMIAKESFAPRERAEVAHG